MPAYNFHYRFATAVQKGVKHQTIRAKRKYRAKVGQTAYLYTGMRTRYCRKLGAWPITAVMHCVMDVDGILLDGAAVKADRLSLLAMLDGFTDWPEMRTWFEKQHGFPFTGDLIMWGGKPA